MRVKTNVNCPGTMHAAALDRQIHKEPGIPPGSVCSPVLCSGGSRSFGHGDVDAPAFLVEVHATFDECENRVVASQTHIPAGTPLGAALPNDDIPRNDRFAAKLLNAQPLSPRIATVPAGALTFLMRHFYVPFPMILTSESDTLLAAEFLGKGKRTAKFRDLQR